MIRIGLLFIQGGEENDVFGSRMLQIVPRSFVAAATCSMLMQ